MEYPLIVDLFYDDGFVIFWLNMSIVEESIEMLIINKYRLKHGLSRVTDLCNFLVGSIYNLLV